MENIFKKLTLVILPCLLLGCATDPWTKEDVQKETAWMILHTIDWGQTRYAMERPDEFKELNPLLGNHPSKGRINTFMGATALGHVLLTHCLDSKERPVWQYISIGIKAGVVGNNYYMGARVDW